MSLSNGRSVFHATCTCLPRAVLARWSLGFPTASCSALAPFARGWLLVRSGNATDCLAHRLHATVLPADDGQARAHATHEQAARRRARAARGTRNEHGRPLTHAQAGDDPRLLAFGGGTPMGVDRVRRRPRRDSGLWLGVGASGRAAPAGRIGRTAGGLGRGSVLARGAMLGRGDPRDAPPRAGALCRAARAVPVQRPVCWLAGRGAALRGVGPCGARGVC